jgi:hypothetical protein
VRSPVYICPIRIGPVRRVTIGGSPVRGSAVRTIDLMVLGSCHIEASTNPLSLKVLDIAACSDMVILRVVER